MADGSNPSKKDGKKSFDDACIKAEKAMASLIRSFNLMRSSGHLEEMSLETRQQFSDTQGDVYKLHGSMLSVCVKSEGKIMPRSST